MAILSILLTAIIIIVSILIVLIVLVQRPKQEGLGAAFGGGTFDSALGAHTSDVLQKITTYFAVIFFVAAIGLSMIESRKFSSSPVDNPLEKVDQRELPTPQLPSGVADLPGIGGLLPNPAPVIQDGAKAGEVKATVPALKAEADAPKSAPVTPAPKGDAPKSAPVTPAPKVDAPKSAPVTPAPKADAPKSAPAKPAPTPPPADGKAVPPATAPKAAETPAKPADGKGGK